MKTDELRAFFNRKCDAIDRRGRERKLKNVDREKLWNWFYDQYQRAFYCSYCGVKLSDDSTQDDRIFTFDHYVPISRGGDNSLSNLELACNACNSVKGRLSADVFVELLETGGRPLVVKIYRDYKEPMVPKVQSDNECDNCYHRKADHCELRIDMKTANNRDSDWCGRWNA
jgi:5-methylcytosine-specific restriction endonuclease McrA